MRKRFIQSQISAVDLFVTPSEGALEQYVRWGIPREQIVHEPHGRARAPRARGRGERGPRNRFGFFGQFTEFKGADVLLEACRSLGRRLRRDGCGSTARTSTRPARSSRTSSRELLEEARGDVRLVGQYDRADICDADGARRLGRGPVDLVGDRAARRCGGVPARPAGDLQRHGRHGREGDRRRQRAALPPRQFAQPGSGDAPRRAEPGPLEAIPQRHPARADDERPRPASGRRTTAICWTAGRPSLADATEDREGAQHV